MGWWPCWKPSPPLVYKPSGSTIHRDVTPSKRHPRYDSLPLPSLFSFLFALTLISALYPYPSRILHDSVGRKHTRPLSRQSLIPSSPSSSTLFFSFSPPSTFAMAALLRSLFGSGQSTTPAHGKAKTRSRTESTPAPSPYYVYTPSPVSTPSTSSSGTSLSKGNTPTISSSPLRYPTYDSRYSHEHSRPPLYRAASHKQPHPDKGS